MVMLRSFLLVSISTLIVAGCDAGSSSATDDGADATPHALKGCSVDPSVSSKIAPGGYYTNGATVCTANGSPHLFHGVDRPSLEWDPKGEAKGGQGIPRSDFDAMAAWHANVVRIALNQDFWLSGAALYVPAYQATVDQAVKDAEAAGLDVILDLHWSDRGDLSVSVAGQGQGKAGHADQQQMADVNSKQFWLEVASKYKNDGHVLFELYNEPHDVSWSAWLNGGTVGGYQVVGMQQLYDTVRNDAGADNIVIAGGVSWAFDLSGASSNRIRGYNIMYATHPYYPQDAEVLWDGKFGYLAAHDIAPVIATEFGDTSTDCTGDWDSKLAQYADARQISWTAWAWWTAGCSFPALILDWDYTPTEQGAAIKSALLSYPYQPAGVPSPGTGNGGGGGTSGGGGVGAAGGGHAGASGANSDAGAGGVSGHAGTGGANTGGSSGSGTSGTAGVGGSVSSAGGGGGAGTAGGSSAGTAGANTGGVGGAAGTSGAN